MELPDTLDPPMVDITGAVSTILARVFPVGTKGLPRRVNTHLPLSHMSMWRLLPSHMSIRRSLPNSTKELLDTLDLPMLDSMEAVSTILARLFPAGTKGLPRRVNIPLPLSHVSMWRLLPS